MLFHRQNIVLSILLLSCCLPFGSILGQDNSSELKPNPARRAYQAITDLKEGALIVRLPGNHKKIEAMEALANDPSVSERNRSRLKKQLEKTKRETDRNNKMLMSAFRKNYDMSALFFTYDTAGTGLSAGIRRGYFLNEDLETDPSIELGDRPFLFLRIGYTDAASTARVYALIVTDSNFRDLGKPFPYYVRLNDIGYVFEKFFASSKADEKNFNKAVIKLNRRLKAFYGS